MALEALADFHYEKLMLDLAPEPHRGCEPGLAYHRAQSQLL